MKIIIEGSPKELAKLAAVLNGAATAEKKTEIPPLLTELSGKEFSEVAGKGSAPQAETAEQDITFASIKPRFEACIKRIKEANSDV